MYPKLTLRLRVLSLVGRMLGIQFHVEGFPFGGPPSPSPNCDCHS